MSAGLPSNIHASCVSVAGKGVVIRGAARSGKSSLAFLLLRRAEALGIRAALVCDDQALIEREGDDVVARAPVSIKGLIEISGVGLVRLPTFDEAPIRLIVDLVPRERIERLPEEREADVLGARIRRVFLPEREAAFAAEVVLALISGNGGWRDA
ncbi:HPr kinase/phosphorylase [Consotaella salsifontis]|uniref:Hpr(Ser) kinase/phosphatase n=1 Tax=Consotaella salsifontis TaxID=1365950 RepID=A0A1T4QHJ4_9HYPH|nr:hypothetical protein [Consotaella salsifontis]SKA03270.1 Hpr(Ser) kinase/phosphatase [Consotaella salsifontis]